MFRFIKKIFLTGLTVLPYVNLLSATPLSCISINNQACKVRPEIINVNSDEPVFYPFSIKTSILIIKYILPIMFEDNTFSLL